MHNFVNSRKVNFLCQLGTRYK